MYTTHDDTSRRCLELQNGYGEQGAVANFLPAAIHSLLSIKPFVISPNTILQENVILVGRLVEEHNK